MNNKTWLRFISLAVMVCMAMMTFAPALAEGHTHTAGEPVR